MDKDDRELLQMGVAQMQSGLDKLKLVLQNLEEPVIPANDSDSDSDSDSDLEDSDSEEDSWSDSEEEEAEDAEDE